MWSDNSVTQIGKQHFLVDTRTRGCAYSSLHQHDFGVECSARRLFSGVMSTPLHDAEFIKPPIKAESDSRYVWKLPKALNGLKKASQLFSNYLSDILVDKLGFKKCSLVPTAFYHSETDLRTAIHVDDPLTITIPSSSGCSSEYRMLSGR